MVSKTLSIHLAKSGRSIDACLEDDHGLVEVDGDSRLPSGTRIFVRGEKPPKPPWWKEYFGITHQVLQTSTGAVVFLPVDDALFILTFGTGVYTLRDDSYDHEFGSKVVLNAVDPEKLKNTDTLDPASSRRQRVQLPFDADLSFFDFSADEPILKSLTGKVRAEYDDIAKSVTGASSLRVTTGVGIPDLPKFCRRLLKLANKTDYQTTFPHLRAITPVSDPDELKSLDANLCLAVFDRDSGLQLTIPDIVNYSDETLVSFSGLGRSPVFDDVYIKQYREYVEGHGASADTITVRDLARHKLRLLDSAHVTKASYSIYRSLVLEVTRDGSDHSYHLSDGTWYRVANTLLVQLRDYIDPRVGSLTWLTPFSDANEGQYNARVANQQGAVLLDRTNVAPQGSTQVEPCDMLRLEGDRAQFAHVKVGTTSDKLSHAFNQGANSAILIKDTPESMERLARLVESSTVANKEPLLAAIKAGLVDVVFAVITHRSADKKSDNLPLFSRVSLRRNMQAIERVGYRAQLVFVRDASESAGVAKKRKPRTSKPET